VKSKSSAAVHPPLTSHIARLTEFARGAGDWPNDLSRRRFLQLTAASAALAGVTGCTRQPLERIVPYVRQPEDLVPGKPLYFASALTLGGYARGVLIETHEGRPTKIEGNPDHPASLGGSDVFMQAELLRLFDPERSQAVMNKGQTSTWDACLGEIGNAVNHWRQNGGAGLRLLTRHETSPTLLDQIRRLLLKYPAAKWHEHEPLASLAPPALYHFDKADVIVSLGSDFLGHGPLSLKYVRDFAAGRRRTDRMNRLYVLESTLTLTGTMADHRVALTPNELEGFAADLASGKGSDLAKKIADDLRGHTGRSVVVPGEFESPSVHEAAHAINQALGNVRVSVEYPAPAIRGRDLRELVDEMRSGAVETLVILAGNPVYDAPAEFAQLMSKVPRVLHLGLYANETAALVQWHVPEAHPLECWSDARSFDGTVTIVQPVIEPLFAGRSRHELMSAMLEEAPATSYDIVRGYWRSQHPAADFEQAWGKALHDGVVVGAALAPTSSAGVSRPTSPGSVRGPQSAGRNSLHLLIRPSSQVYDGRFANNAWLQEFPDPLTTIVWDNAALVSPATAKWLKVESGDVVNLKFNRRAVRSPVWILPGQADDCVTIHLGYGRSRAGRVGNGVGFNAYALRTWDALWGGPGLEWEKTGERHDFATTQNHWNMEGRGEVRIGTIAQFQKKPDAIVATEEAAPASEETLYPKVDYTGYAWGMAIDLNACIGCGACTIACQAENNIPVVGKEQVARGRQMHWIRVDRYFEEGDGRMQSLHQPVPCMHCENAPCELVCPVAATVHSAEGLNQMVYNRCVGTRYCSNNCPYKVRRFNFLEYDANQFEQPITRKLMRNPNVTVRSRGVMEKCTYCVQRINAVKIEAEKADRPIRDGEITPACAQACPAEAIVFGDINDAKNRVRKLRESPLNYGLLAELNTRPRTTYLARLRNPNSEVEKI
jgi:Fe-S-cluster-containing dehydrogenase component